MPGATFQAAKLAGMTLIGWAHIDATTTTGATTIQKQSGGITASYLGTNRYQVNSAAITAKSLFVVNAAGGAWSIPAAGQGAGLVQLDFPAGLQNGLAFQVEIWG